MVENKRSTGRARGIDRVIEILAYLHEQRAPVRVSEIARATQSPRSSLYDLINRLVDAELLEAHGGGRLYFGPAMHYYGAEYARTNPLMHAAQREIDRLADRWGETTQFCTLHGDKYTVLIMNTGQRTFRITSDVGVKVPIPWTASGRLLLSDMSDEQIRNFIPAEDYQLQDGRRIDPEAFLRDIAQARHDDYATTYGLVDTFTICIAAPVRATSGEVVATLCFVTTKESPPDYRQRLLASLLTSARRLSRAPE